MLLFDCFLLSAFYLLYVNHVEEVCSRESSFYVSTRYEDLSRNIISVRLCGIELFNWRIWAKIEVLNTSVVTTGFPWSE